MWSLVRSHETNVFNLSTFMSLRNGHTTSLLTIDIEICLRDSLKFMRHPQYEYCIGIRGGSPPHIYLSHHIEEVFFAIKAIICQENLLHCFSSRHSPLNPPTNNTVIELKRVTNILSFILHRKGFAITSHHRKINTSIAMSRSIFRAKTAI